MSTNNETDQPQTAAPSIDSSGLVGTDAEIIDAIRILERYAKAGMGVGVDIDGHTGIRCQITSKVECDGETILEAVKAAVAMYDEVPTAKLSRRDEKL